MKQPKKPEFHRLTIDLDIKDYGKLKEMAEREDRSASKQAKVLITKGLDEDE